MIPFITQVLQELLSRNKSLANHTFILPSKRAGSFLITELAKLSENPSFAPQVFSIEEFSEEMSGLKAIDNTTALFEFYSVYLQCTPKDKIENFDTFSSWAQTLLYDFNEIDRYLIDYKPFFNYLSDIQEINHWSAQKEKTSLMENYLSFWQKLPEYYEALRASLEQRKMAYQGMVYRRASEGIEKYVEDHKNPHIFLGFNALNNAEQKILQKMESLGVAQIFWDIDEVFLKDTQHDASLFMRRYKRDWPMYQDKNFEFVSRNFSGSKNIQMTAVPGNIGQAKYVGELLANLSPEEMRKTAVVLGDESLLLPVLNSLPQNVEEINVTMGFPLNAAPVTSLFEELLRVHTHKKHELYFKDVIGISNHPLVQKITFGFSKEISGKIQQDNLVYFSTAKLLSFIPEKYSKIFSLCFEDWKDDPHFAISQFQKLIFEIKGSLDKEKDQLTLEFLYQYHLLFNKLTNLLETYSHVRSIKTLYTIFKELLASQTVDFHGKPFTGLQLMGMLESRGLDFENVIITSVNEGVLPAGKSSNSFIPYDLKCSYDLPTYKEKDAVYTYHFYHLLQRAKNVQLLYNTESDGLSAGEKSRFLLQLEMEKQEAHNMKKITVAPKVPAIGRKLQQVEKNEEILEKLKQLADRGFSPSALTTYIRNPIDFYRQYILGIKEKDEVEETIAYNTLGTVVHDTLETFYKNWIGEELTMDKLKEAVKRTPAEVAVQFQKTYTKEPLKKGKNLLIFEVAKRYVINLLKMDMNFLKDGNILKILEVESDLRTEIPIEELDFPVFLRGKVDRYDCLNGKKRIIDYKTGNVNQNQVEIVDWEDLTSDYNKYGKTFQILSYACMLNAEKAFNEPVEAGIISFKNLQNGFLKYSKKDKPGAWAKKDPDIDENVLEAYRAELKKLITEICDPEIPFLEKEIPSQTW
ncbi:PD-(D/E)XK nuclease family protein [Salinimicrobium sp. GXAS 041]|uniref:PD-(D/E)XK nuclease family protein n=1 Tax=Salinimicrobium sp. GXAS 041 TaxID=3400806 RepID=UPI003C75CF76